MKPPEMPEVPPDPMIRYDNVGDGYMDEYPDGEFVSYESAIKLATYWWNKWRSTCLYVNGMDWSKPSFCEECLTDQTGSEWQHKPGCMAADESSPK